MFLLFARVIRSFFILAYFSIGSIFYRYFSSPWARKTRITNTRHSLCTYHHIFNAFNMFTQWIKRNIYFSIIKSILPKKKINIHTIKLKFYTKNDSVINSFILFSIIQLYRNIMYTGYLWIHYQICRLLCICLVVENGLTTMSTFSLFGSFNRTQPGH
jgi:hypothetical protein